MAKRKLIGRKRKFNRAQVFPKREDKELAWIMYRLRETFPDPVERKQYIEKLIEGLDKEPIVEI